NILITGASKGIGLEIGKRLVTAGHTVIGTSRKPQSISDAPFKLLPLEVGSQESAEAFIESAIAELGHIDVLINNAGYDLYAAAEEAGIQDTAAQLDTNFLGTVRVTTATLPHMRKRGKGFIINMSSIGGFLGLPYNSAYAASKFALEGYSESLRLELLPFGICVSLVEPQAVATETLDTSIVGASTPHPTYAKRSAELIGRMREMGRNSPVSTHTVAEKVVQIVASSKPKLRYPVGNQSRYVPYMKQLLPQRLFERFMVAQFVNN
ncbi:MAG: SDR family oxidoreductase, partial [Chloroflexota bacterium]